jgi:PIN domain nuclease of toxin-antitoxin system
VSLLLDTHVLLWWLNDDPKLTEELKDQLDHDPDVYVSSVTVWEVAIKHASGKLEGPSDLPEQIRDNGFIPLAVDHDHALAAGRLPMVHRDPFDRLLIAQAQCEELTLVTHDRFCQKYDVSILAV